MRTTRAAGGLVALAIALGAGLTACGDDEHVTSVRVSTTDHNDADVAFATDMIRHHAQALAMVDLTLDRPLDPKVQSLADEIRAAQGPEIETMSDWLTDWDEEVPETMRDHANAGHDMGDMGGDMGVTGDGDLPGVMTAEDMRALADASDAEFQDRWLALMIEHHQGAVEMAQAAQDEGQYKPAVELAADIEESQTDEIDTMQGLLGS